MGCVWPIIVGGPGSTYKVRLGRLLRRQQLLYGRVALSLLMLAVRWHVLRLKLSFSGMCVPCMQGMC